MQPKHRLAVRLSVVLAAAALLGAGWSLRHWAVDTWFILKLASEDADVWRGAAATLLERKSVRAVAPLARARLHRDTAEMVRECRKLVVAFGDDFRDAFPVFTEGLSDSSDEVRIQSLEVLRRVARRFPEAVPALASALETGPPDFRRKVAYVLAEIGPAAHAAAPALERALASSDEDLAVWAAIALGEMAPASRGSIPTLIRFLEGASSRVAASCAVALAQNGPHASPAVPALIRTLRSSDPLVRVYSAWALLAIGEGAREALPHLEAAVADPSFGSAPGGGAVSGGWHSGLGLEEIFDKFRPFEKGGSFGGLQDRGVDGRLVVVQALAELGAAAAAALPLLVERLERGGYAVVVAGWALQSLGPRAAPAVPAILDAAGKAQLWPGRFAVHLLVGIGPAAVPHLVDGLQAESASTRILAAAALAELGRKAGSSAEALRLALDDEDPRVRLQAAIALLRMEGGSSVLLPKLFEALRALEDDCPWALDTVWSDPADAGPDFVPVGPAFSELLAERLDDPSDCVKRHAVLLLGSLGPTADPAVPRLLELLAGDSEDVAEVAARALGSIRSRPAAVAAALLEAFSADDPPSGEHFAFLGASPGPILRSLSAFGREAAGAARPLLDSLRRTEPQFRFSAAQRILPVIGKIASPESGIGRELAAELRGETSVTLQRELVGAIAEIAPRSRDVVSALRTVSSRSSDGLVRVRSARGLWRIDRNPETVLPLLREALRDERYWGIELYVGRPEFADDPTAVLHGRDIVGLGRPDYDPKPNRVRQEAAEAAGELGPSGKPLVPELVDCLQRQDPMLRAAAAVALWRVDGRAEVEELVAFVKQLSEPEWGGFFFQTTVPLDAVDVLGEIGPRAKEAVPHLEELLERPLGPYRANVTAALEKIRGKPSPAREEDRP